MMNPRDMHSRKLIEVIEQIPLPKDKMALAEDYLMQEAGDEVLEQFDFQDLSEIEGGKSAKVFYELTRKGRKEEAGRLFKLLFAIGWSTCCHMTPIGSLYTGKDQIIGEADKVAAVYAPEIGMQQYLQNGQVINRLIALADNDPEVIKRAAGYQKNKFDNGKLVLLAVYFMMKYSGAEESSIKSEGFLENIGKIFGPRDKAKEAVVQIEKEDIPLMEQYENIIISSFDNMYKNQIDPHTLSVIQKAVRENSMPGKVLQLANKAGHVDAFLLKFLGSMAYLNFRLSVRLKNIVRLSLAVSTETALDAMLQVSRGLPADIGKKGGNYDRIFEIDSARYLRWAANKNLGTILKEQLAGNQNCFLKVLEEVDADTSGRMIEVLKESKPELCQTILANRSGKAREKLIAVLIGNDYANGDIIKGYLRGETKVDALYPYADQIAQKNTYSGWRERNSVNEYRKHYQDEAFDRRCQVYMLMKHYLYFFHDEITQRVDSKGQKIEEIFRNFDKEGLTVERQLSGFVLFHDFLYGEKNKRDFTDIVEKCFGEYLENRREETVSAFLNAEAAGRFLGLRVMEKDARQNKKEILSYTQDGSKVVKEELLHILCQQREWEEEVMALFASKKAAERELAIKTLLSWQEQEKDYQDLFRQALEKEKNGKVRELLCNALRIEPEKGSGAKVLAQEDLVKEMHKGGKKRSLAWAYETPFSQVHKSNGDLAQEEYLQAVLLCYASMGKCGISQNAVMLAQDLNQEEFAVYVNELFDKWLEAGAEAKKRWVLYASSIHGGPEIISKLKHQIQEWPQHARGAIASDAVEALALNPLPQALLIVDGIARKFKFKQVKAAAGRALEFAAEQLGITSQELADRIVPDLGFDENMERSFDYGERTFRVTITPELEIEIFDETGKKLKNMPAPGKRDDEQKAKASYEEFKQMKKQMKMTITSQKMRLEQALSTGREWSVEAWKNLFVKNPVMHQFAIGLIWGIYEDRKLICSFRYMEDGSFNTQDEEEYELAAEGKIGLVHPIELDEEGKKAWQEQLEDYEITQPVEQIKRPVYRVTKEEENSQSMDRFGGCIINDLSLGGKLLGAGWYRGSVTDGGGFDTYYREDAETGLGVELHFSGSFVGGENEEVTIYDARFYKAGDVKRGSYVYDEADKEKACFLKDVPPRYFSEVVMQIAKAAASSSEKDENWKSGRMGDR